MILPMAVVVSLLMVQAPCTTSALLVAHSRASRPVPPRKNTSSSSRSVIAATANKVEKTIIDGVPVHPEPLFRNAPLQDDDDDDDVSPYCLVASTPAFDRPHINFLSTQLWPSARTAALWIHRHVDVSAFPTICEFGCGPGLPSLTAAAAAAAAQRRRGGDGDLQRVVATDLDSFALQLVSEAARQQGLDHVVETMVFDLVGNNSNSNNFRLPKADLYILSDVFESATVARGAAHVVHQALVGQEGSAHVWVFAQSDRVQREVFLQEIQSLLPNEKLQWVNPHDGPPSQARDSDRGVGERLWLCDIDETTVFYG